MPPRIVLATAGSLGDLHPFIALALALKARGFEAEIASSPQHGDKIRAEGLTFHPIGPSIAELEVMMGMTEVEITEAVTRSSGFLFEKMLLPHLERGARELLAVAQGAVAIVGSTFAAGAAIAADGLGVPFVPVALQPAIVFSAFDPPALPNAPWLAPASGGWRLALNRLTLAGARARGAAWTGPTDRVRQTMGLKPQRANLLLDGLKNRPLALGLYSPLLGLPQADAPPAFAVTGHASYDSETGGPTPLSPALEAFLAAGPEPIVFTLGSAAVIIPGRFYVESLKAARSLGRRAVLLVGPKGDVGVADGPDAIAVAYAPYSTLFPRAAAVVHQGGVGTTQQALRAGRPQLVVPFLGDQFDNAARVVRLGCGATLGRGRYRADRAATALERLLADPGLVDTAARIGRVAAQEDGAAVAAERIIALVTPAPRDPA